jgi:hypothetical protein
MVTLAREGKWIVKLCMRRKIVWTQFCEPKAKIFVENVEMTNPGELNMINIIQNVVPKARECCLHLKATKRWK